MPRTISGAEVVAWRRLLAAQYHGPLAANEAAGGAMTNGMARGIPYPVSSGAYFDRIGISVFTAGTTGSVVRLAVCHDDTVVGPNALVADCGTVDSTTTGRKEINLAVALGANLYLGPGLYWLFSVGQGAPATVPNCKRTVNPGEVYMPWTPQGWASDYAAAVGGFRRDGITGAFPSTLTPVVGDFSGVDMPYVWLRRT